MSKENRLNLVKKIEEKRGSKLLTYVTGDRPNLPFNIGGDTPRLFYDHLLGFGKKIPKLDLLLYSSGGDTSVPWRIISLFREFAEEINVLIPFRAYSAATLICLGADAIYMGKKGELGPIDPTVNSEFNPVDITTGNRRLPINVEDITAYISLLKDKVGLIHQPELGAGFNELAKAVSPVALGYVNRHYSFIRMVATKLLKSHKHEMSDTKTSEIVTNLVEKIYFHGHGIARAEARDMGLEIHIPDSEIEDLMWKLYLEYEDALKLQSIFNPMDILQDNNVDDFVVNDITGAFIESSQFSHVYKLNMKLNLRRATPQAMNMNVNFQIPPGVDPNNVPPQLLQQWQLRIQRLVMEEIKRQSNVIGIDQQPSKFRWEKELWT